MRQYPADRLYRCKHICRSPAILIRRYSDVAAAPSPSQTLHEMHNSYSSLAYRTNSLRCYHYSAVEDILSHEPMQYGLSLLTLGRLHHTNTRGKKISTKPFKSLSVTPRTGVFVSALEHVPQVCHIDKLLIIREVSQSFC